MRTSDSLVLALRECCDQSISRFAFSRTFSYPALCQLVNRLKKGCRLLTYENLDVVFTKVYGDIPSESTHQAAAQEPSAASDNIEEDDDLFDEDLSVDLDPPLSGKVVQHVSKHGSARTSTAASCRLSKLSSSAPSILTSPPILPVIAQPARVGAPAAAPGAGGGGGGGGGSRESKRKRTSPGAGAMRKSSGVLQQQSSVEFDLETTSSTSSLSSLAVGSSRVISTRPAASGAPASSTRGSSPTPCTRHPYNPFRQYPVNLSKSDRFFTSWATNLGHRFFLYHKDEKRNDHLPQESGRR